MQLRTPNQPVNWEENFMFHINLGATLKTQQNEESLRVDKMGNTYIRNSLSQCIYTLSQPQDPKSQAYMVARLLCFTTPTDATCMFKRKKNSSFSFEQYHSLFASLPGQMYRITKRCKTPLHSFQGCVSIVLSQFISILHD